METKKTYFLSDFHLGAGYHLAKAKERGVVFPQEKDELLLAQHEVERKLCRWLDYIKHDAGSIYLLGDIFDYWFEYKNVVPRGFTRFLGKLAEIADRGVDIHFFIGNHDIWLTDYLKNEIGMTIHRETFITDIQGKKFYMHHGDGLGNETRTFKLLRKIFHSQFLRKLYAGIHPHWTVGFAKRWSNHSRIAGGDEPFKGEKEESLVCFAKNELQKLPDINYFIFGHRHIMLDLMLRKESRIIILGDWISYFSYAIFDGQNLTLEIFEEEKR